MNTPDILKRDARKKLESKSEVINDSLWYVNPNDLDKIVNHIYQQVEELVAHKTEDGYCCACEYDISVMNEKIEQAVEGRDKEWHEALQDSIYPGEGNKHTNNVLKAIRAKFTPKHRDK